MAFNSGDRGGTKFKVAQYFKRHCNTGILIGMVSWHHFGWSFAKKTILYVLLLVFYASFLTLFS
jgi:hypothetical protein